MWTDSLVEAVGGFSYSASHITRILQRTSNDHGAEVLRVPSGGGVLQGRQGGDGDGVEVVHGVVEIIS